MALTNISNASLNTTGNITLPGNYTIAWPPSEQFQIIILSLVMAVLLAILAIFLWKRHHKSDVKSKRYFLASPPQMWLPESDDIMLNKLKDAEKSLVKIAENIHNELVDKDNWQQKYITARIESFLRDIENDKK